MKYCTQCGAEIMDQAIICLKCGCETEYKKEKDSHKNDGLKLCIKVFMVIQCITLGFALIPLAWCIPMTVKAFRHFKEGTPLSTRFKVCTFIFVGFVPGVCMMCMPPEGN